MKTYYEFPKPFKTFVWVMLCLFNVLVVFAACYMSAKSVQGYTLAVTGFVLVLLTYSHEKERRKLLSWPLIAYAFYSILVNSYTLVQTFADKERVQSLGAAYTLYLYGATAIPYIFGGVAAVTTGLFAFLTYKQKKINWNRLLKASFTVNLVVMLLSSILS